MNVDEFMKPEFAYWIGIVQTDGCLKEWKHKNGCRQRVIDISNKNIAILQKVQEISCKFLKRYSKIIKRKSRDIMEYKIGVQRLMPLFTALGIVFSKPPIPPLWTMRSNNLFGAYLAGVIDGDGNVRIKKSRRRCVIRIISGKNPTILSESIRRILNCSTYIEFKTRESRIGDRKIFGRYHTLEFYVSKKNINFIKNFLLPYMVSHKALKLNEFFAP